MKSECYIFGAAAEVAGNTALATHAGKYVQVWENDVASFKPGIYLHMLGLLPGISP